MEKASSHARGDRDECTWSLRLDLGLGLELELELGLGLVVETTVLGTYDLNEDILVRIVM